MIGIEGDADDCRNDQQNRTDREADPQPRAPSAAALFARIEVDVDNLRAPQGFGLLQSAGPSKVDESVSICKKRAFRGSKGRHCFRGLVSNSLFPRRAQQ